MLEITLMKSMYNEMDPDKIKEVEVLTNDNDAKYHKLNMSLPDYPQLQSITVEVQYKAYGIAMYYLHINDQLDVQEDIQTPMAKAAILHFFSTYQPDFIKPDLPADLSEVSILDCFEPDKIPDYRPKHAFPGLVLFEDIEKGNLKPTDSSMPTFPGLRMLNKDSEEDSRPAYIAKGENYTEFHGDNDEFQKELEKLKLQFQIKQ